MPNVTKSEITSGVCKIAATLAQEILNKLDTLSPTKAQIETVDQIKNLATSLRKDANWAHYLGFKRGA